MPKEGPNEVAEVVAATTIVYLKRQTDLQEEDCGHQSTHTIRQPPPSSPWELAVNIGLAVCLIWQLRVTLWQGGAVLWQRSGTRMQRVGILCLGSLRGWLCIGLGLAVWLQSRFGPR
eukprot:6736029-Pyramimonas_sp.AAC.1